jgi:flagellar biosynthesis protein FlhB
MAQADRDQRTEAPTEKRKRDAARDGDILQSRDLSTALVMLAGASWMMLAGPWFIGEALRLLKAGLTIGAGDVADFNPVGRAATMVLTALPPLAALFALTLLAAVAAPAALGALGFRSGALAFKASRIDPLAGIGRIFGAQGLVELGKSLVKIALIGAIGWWFVASSLATMIGLGHADPHRSAGAIGLLFGGAVIWLAGGLGVIGLIDAPVQFMRRMARLRMSKHEIREETKESEGAPETKMQARQRRHELLNGSARKAVTEASVVLTNPTHFAIALRYRPGKDAVPMVVARGRGETALAIRALAKEAAVPTLEYPQLTRAIYFTARAGQPIAQDLYVAVATILAFVFNLDRAVAEGMTPPDVAVPPAKTFDADGRPRS